MISIKDFEHFRQETINESIEERNNFYNFKSGGISSKIIGETEKRFIKKILQLISDENIVELQSILKNDILNHKNPRQKNSKYNIFVSLIENEYINSELVPTNFVITRVDDISKTNVILNSIPTLTNEGFKELEKLKENYKD
ncbi:hypothetical protein [Fusobacterium hwasookii]|uniref:hypothetical protein n=1 Tax=Fusobacterium hwasookii TaxID=1583098 RepID=UPI0028ED8B8F|nr:hypothetical protein [Fusobacterium hwasookii]